MKTQMEQNNITHEHERVIKLSVHPLDYSGTAKDYRVNDIKISKLEELFSKYNYSPIIWKNSDRATKNFLYATGFCVDIDHGMTIDQAEKILFKHQLNYALATTKSCTADEHRFRVFIPFSNKVYTYEKYLRVAKEIDKLFDSKCDPKVFDGARQLYGSGKIMYFSSRWTGNDFDVSSFTGIDLSQVKYGNGDWDDNLMVRTKDQQEISVKEIKEKTSIYCPFHDDKHPSAFINYSPKSDNWFINCQSPKCGRTYWKTKVQKPLEERCAPYWSHTSKIYESGIIGDSYYLKEIGEKKYFTFIEALTKVAKNEAYEYLLKHHHIPSILRIDYYGNPLAQHHTYEVKPDDGLIKVCYTALPVDVKDNQFIEDYLDSTFGSYKDFIKQYLAVYAYSDYRKLPTLILVGKRGVGKSIFAEVVGEIYPQRFQVWTAKEESFNAELQKKLLIADETVSNKKENYLYLKRLSGQKYHSINEKFTPKYQVLNNVNVIILSNNLLPIYVEREELPTNPSNNQFFVYEIKGFNGPLDAELHIKLKKRLGYYVRTELKKVFDSLDLTQHRYSISVPITDDEKKLFKSSVSLEQMKADKFMQDIIQKVSVGEYKDFTDAGYLPVDALCDALKITSAEKHSIVRNLRERGYLSEEDGVRKMINTSREYCYRVTDKFNTKVKIDCLVTALEDTTGNKE